MVKNEGHFRKVQRSAIGRIRGRSHRPTTDRVKETLFNKLIGQIEGARILDLFSGTGNLAIECLSRGAAQVDLVESHKKSLAIIRQNLRHLKIDQGFEIFPLDVFRYIENYSGDPYGGVLADPPFTQALAHDLAGKIGASSLLAENSWLVIEATRKNAWTRSIRD